MRDPHPGHEKMIGYLSIPYLGHDGRVLTIRFRRLGDGGGPKYRSIAGDPARVYNVRAIHEAGDEISICEGELDALILNHVGIPAIALPGATSWRPHHRRMLAGFSRVHVWGDPDAAGGQMVNAITRSLRTARPVQLTDGDVNETFLKHGAEHLRSLIQ